MKKPTNDPYVTRSYLDKALKRVVKEITEIVVGHIQHVDQRLGRVEKDVGVLKKDVGILKTDMHDVKRQLTDLKLDTPTQKEFNLLKARVDRNYPLS